MPFGRAKHKKSIYIKHRGCDGDDLMKKRRPYLSLMGFLLAISFSIAGCTWFNDATFEGVDSPMSLS